MLPDFSKLSSDVNMRGNNEDEEDETEECENNSDGDRSETRDFIPLEYAGYKCTSIGDLDKDFSDFTTEEKLAALEVLVMIGYRLPFAATFFAQRFKGSHEAEVKKLRERLDQHEKRLESAMNEVIVADAEVDQLSLKSDS